MKACHPEIVHNFAEITRMYQLAYCYTIIESNTRSQLPIFNGKKTVTPTVENFLPITSYTLRRSGQRLTPLFRDNITSNVQKSVINYKEDIEYMTD